MDYRKSKTIYEICLYIGLALILIAAFMKVLWALIIGAIILFGGIIQAGIFFRCPHCRKMLDFRARKPKYCPNCGKELFLGK